MKEAWNAIREIGKHSTEGVLVLDLINKTVIYKNEVANKITRFSGESFPFDLASLLQTIIEEDRPYVISKFANLKSTSFSTEVEFRLKQSNDETLFVCCNGHLISNGAFLVLFVKDISKPKQHEKYLIEFGTKKNTMLDMVAHHFSGALMLMKHLSAEGEKAVQFNNGKDLSLYFNLLKENSNNCIAMIESLLKEEHSKSPGISIKTSRIDVVEKIKFIYDELKLTYAARDISFQTSSPSIYLNTDEFKLLQIVNNFVSNAVKFTEPDRKISFSIEEQDHHVLIQIVDNGIGIPMALQPFIFDRQSIAGREGLNGESSSGLGLSICRQLAEMLNIELGFKSSEGVGSRFYILLKK